MLVMGGIVGSGIFMNPSVVARQVHSPFLILGAWVAGGGLALLGAFIWAELATRLPEAGGQYVYLREAYHPAVSFLYGWVLLLVTQTGGMAAVAVTFARYFREISGITAGDSAIAAVVLLALTVVNCFGARAGSNVQSALMLTKTAAIAAMVVVGFALGGGHLHPLPLLDRPPSFGLVAAIGASMIPVAFAYGGWQTATFVAGEMRHPGRDLSRGLIARRGWGGGALPLRERGLRQGAGPGRTGRHHHPRIGRDARRPGRARRLVDRAGHRRLHPRIPGAGHAHRAARLQRHGARRPLFRTRRAVGSAHRRPRHRHRAARRGLGRDRLQRQLRTDPQLCGHGGFHLLRTDRVRPLPPAASANPAPRDCTARPATPGPPRSS